MITNILNTIFIYKSNNTIREIKICTKINNNIITNFTRGKGDIINNININSYINYNDCNLIRKRKARSPNLLSKDIEFKTNNNNSYKYDYYNKKNNTLTTSNSEKFISINRHNNKKK